MNIPSLLVVFIGGWGVSPNKKDQFFSTDAFSFLEEYVSAYPLVSLSVPAGSIAERYRTIGAVNDELGQSLMQSLLDHQIKSIAIAGSERYSALTEAMVSQEKGFEENHRYYLPIPPAMSVTEHPETNLPEMMRTVDAQFKHSKDSVIFTCIETLSSIGRYNRADSMSQSVQLVDKHLRKIIQEGISNGLRVLVVGDPSNDSELAPALLIAKDLEGLRASDNDYASGSLLPLVPSGDMHDIAPTILSLMHIPKPEGLPGKNLFEDKLTYL